MASGLCTRDVFDVAHCPVLWYCGGIDKLTKTYRPDTVRGDPMNAHQREWLEGLRAYAQLLGGDCLAWDYTNSNDRILWRCAKGHEWVASAGSVRHGTWCGICARAAAGLARREQTFKRVRKIAREKGGLCVSSRCVNAHSHLLWRCAEGHEWVSTPVVIRAGRWCPVCERTVRWRDTKAEIFARVQAIAREKGGLCISTEYANCESYLRWRCAKGHEWEATPLRIGSGSWCRRCAGMARFTIEEMQELAGKKGGRCISESYVNTGTRLHWQCAEGHEWTAFQGQLRQGLWCPHCAGSAPKTIATVREIVARYGGVCLATTMKGSHDRLSFRCREGHEFKIEVRFIHRGMWCSPCAKASQGR